MPAILLKPVARLMAMLCSASPVSAHNITSNATYDRQNIVVFPKYTPGHARPLGDWRCLRCSSEQFVVRKENRICLFCGESKYYEAEAAICRASTGPRIYNDNSAKRVTHFKNWIQRIQGKERCAITSDQIELLRQQVALYPDLSEAAAVRAALKTLKMKTNHVYYVMRQIYGYGLVEFRKINEARLLALFMRIQEPFRKICCDRTNMLSYQFLIRKFCELLGYKIADCIPLLKSRPNLQRQDLIWRKICDELGLPYYASV